jgi:hypothetical protein
MFNLNLLYIDPATGTAVIAMILGGISGIMLYIKTKWQTWKYKIKK